MNYIIWNGKDSREIKGLLISELPPITKPEMKVKETVVDGRDGSTFEELGYSSYEKSILIGLYGDYDINEVIKYFTGEGEITFSNEPDKYYKAKIFTRIDYTRLLRYRQATISFKVQPYKYKRNETPIRWVLDTSNPFFTVTNEGNAESKPLIVISGSGMVPLFINGTHFQYTFPENEREVAIDCELQEAYLDSELKNRNMLGEFPVLVQGPNEIFVDVSSKPNLNYIEVLPRSRWL